MLLYGESETVSACINDTDELTQAVTRNNSKKLKHNMKERGHSTQVKIKDAEKAPEKSHLRSLNIALPAPSQHDSEKLRGVGLVL